MEKTAKQPRHMILFPVFIPAVALVFLMVVGTISKPELAATFFSDICLLPHLRLVPCCR